MDHADGDDGDALLLAEHGETDEEGGEHHTSPADGGLPGHPAVLEDHHQEEDGGEELGPAHHPRHGLRVDGVDGEEEGGQGGREPGEEAARQVVVEQSDASV